MSDAEQAQRLRQFAESVGGPSKLAEKLGISPQSMSNYLAGRNVAGPKMRMKLKSLGCDIDWLLTGVVIAREEEEQKRQQDLYKKKNEASFRVLNPEKAKLLDVIHKHGIETAEQLDWILTARHMILNEPQSEYKGKGKKK